MAAGLLLAVAAEADVDRQLARRRELARRGEQHEELALVVDGAAAVEVAVAQLGLERPALPQVERVGRLHVEVAVADDRRRVAAPLDARISPMASGWPSQSTTSASPPTRAHEVAHPLARAHDVAGVRGVGADRGDPQELRELVEPGLGPWRRSLAVDARAARGPADRDRAD